MLINQIKLNSPEDEHQPTEMADPVERSEEFSNLPLSIEKRRAVEIINYR